LLPECIFSTLKNSLKNLTKNAKTRKIADILETAKNIANPQNLSLRRYF